MALYAAHKHQSTFGASRTLAAAIRACPTCEDRHQLYLFDKPLIVGWLFLLAVDGGSGHHHHRGWPWHHCRGAHQWAAHPPQWQRALPGRPPGWQQAQAHSTATAAGQLPWQQATGSGLCSSSAQAFDQNTTSD